MKKYVSPKYQVATLDIEDIMLTSSIFTEEKNEEDDKVDYVVTPESIFGF